MSINTTTGEKSSASKKSLFDISRKILLAGIGAMALAQDEVEEFINKLVERGEIAEKDGRKLVREILEKRNLGGGKADDLVEKRVKEVLDRFDVPTKTDIENLSKKISSLSKKVDDLKKQA